MSKSARKQNASSEVTEAVASGDMIDQVIRSASPEDRLRVMLKLKTLSRFHSNHVKLPTVLTRILTEMTQPINLPAIVIRNSFQSIVPSADIEMLYDKVYLDVGMNAMYHLLGHTREFEIRITHCTAYDLERYEEIVRKVLDEYAAFDLHLKHMNITINSWSDLETIAAQSPFMTFLSESSFQIHNITMRVLNDSRGLDRALLLKTTLSRLTHAKCIRIYLPAADRGIVVPLGPIIARCLCLKTLILINGGRGIWYVPNDDDTHFSNTTLQSLEVDNMHSLRNLSSAFPSLRTLKCTELLDKNISGVQDMEIEDLDLRFVTRWEPTPDSQPEWSSPISTLHSLKCLNLCNESGVGGSFDMRMLPKSTSQISLRVHVVARHLEDSLANGVLPNASRIELTNAKHTKDSVWEKLKARKDTLTFLHLGGTDLVVMPSTFIPGMIHLSHVKISNSSMFQKLSIAGGIHHTHPLKSLHVTICKKFSTVAIDRNSLYSLRDFTDLCVSNTNVAWIDDYIIDRLDSFNYINTPLHKMSRSLIKHHEKHKII